jgi:hypothetical protein
MKSFTKILFVVLSLLAISACEKKSCKNVVCASYQTCNAGQCLCQNGYEGDTCSVLSSTKYIGDWQVVENCSPDPPNFAVYYTNIRATIMGSTYYAPNVIYFDILLGSGPVYAQILNTSASSEGLSIYIPPQNLTNGVSIQGGSQGYYSAAVNQGAKPTMSITINYSYQGNSYTCYETFRKQ